VEEVPKFSKFIHGVATLLDHRVSLLPFWLPQMDKDIRKTPAVDFKLSGGVTPAMSSDNVFATKSHTSSATAHHQDIQVIVENPEEGGEDERTPLLLNQGGSPARRQQKDSSVLASMFGKMAKVFKGKTSPVESSQGEGPNAQILAAHAAASSPAGARPSVRGPSDAITGPQKRIILPVRIEPKVFFANERTFLSWLHFCIVLGGLALGLLNFGDQVGQISGLIFTIVAMMFIIYALFLYQWRAHQIRNRRKCFIFLILKSVFGDLRTRGRPWTL
jgi:uncharacterized membrane protein YidH (DUF202 family)